MPNNNDKMIIRVAKNKDNPYVMMNKTGLNDPRLSFKAKGILAYLLSKPDDWKVMVEELINSSADGKRAVYSGLKELETYGYIKRKRVYRIDETTGRNVIDRWEMLVYEIPPEENEDSKEEHCDSSKNKNKAESLDITGSFVLLQNVEVQNEEVQNEEVQNEEVQNEEIQNVEIGFVHVENAPLLNNEYILNNDYTKYNNNNSKKRKGRNGAKKESPRNQGDKIDDVEKTLLVNLKYQIEQLTGGKVQIQTLQRILAQERGLEKIKHAFNVYPHIRNYITRFQPIENAVGLFFYIAENMVDLPVSIPSTGRKLSFNNFEQHTYSDEELESLYENIDGDQ